MPNISNKTLLLIGGIVIVIAIIIGLAVGLTKPKSISESDLAKEKDNKLINDALNRSGIQIKSENFQNNIDIVFDSYDKIKKNFNLFMNTYYPSIDINDMNNMLKTKYGVPKTMQELIMENLDAPNMDGFFGFEGLIEVLIDLGKFHMTEYLTKGISNNIICSGLALILQIKIYNKIKNINEKLIYLNDFNKTDDFYIYFLPQSYDISKLSTTNDIPIMNPVKSSDHQKYYSGNDLINPYKIGMIYLLREDVKFTIQLRKSSAGGTSAPWNTMTVSNDEINNAFKVYNDNIIPYYKLFKFYLIGPFIVLYTKQAIPTTSQFKIDMKEIIKPDNYTKDYIKLQPIPEDYQIDMKTFDAFGVLKTV